ncbi:ankyrin-1-like [Haliotis rufescens]|uniref:ankyrin-1-like n=1 Tax=Haliotis rufescens TaxID=6454 RepID=UPI00201E8C74|nr:ankyrin-1-like [Haliotis rufescens]
MSSTNINTDLYQACCSGRLDAVTRILQEDRVDINTRGAHGWTPVMAAAHGEHVGVFKLLHRKQADMSLLDEDGDTILHVACSRNRLKIVKLILSDGRIDINVRGKHGWTPVMVAARHGCRHVYLELINNINCDVRHVGDDGDNLLHLACLKGHLFIVEHLLSRKIFNINCRGKLGRTPIMKAAWAGSRRIFDLIIEKGGSTSLLDDKGLNILHVACAGGKVHIVKYILSKRLVGINSRRQDGRTPLMVAAECGHKDVYNLLLKEGGDRSMKDTEGNNILHVACRGGYRSMVQHICDRNLPGRQQQQIHGTDTKGRTPLMAAAETGHKEAFEIVRRKGGDITIRDSLGNKLIYVACLGGDLPMIMHIASLDFTDGLNDGRMLILAAESGRKDVFDFLLGEGCDLSLDNEEEDTVFHAACRGGHVDMVEYVLSRFTFDINKRGKYKGRTALMMAVEKGNMKVFDLLLTKQCDVFVVDEDNDNILHVACMGGHAEMVKYIVSKGYFDINCKGKHGRTPMMFAAEFGNIDVFYFTVCKGGDVSEVDADGMNILHLACLGNNVIMVTELLTLELVDIDTKDCRGQTPAMLAARQGNRDVLELLIREHANLLHVDNHGDNMLQLACIRDNMSIANYLLLKHFFDINSAGRDGRTPVMVAANRGCKPLFDLLVKEGAILTLVDVYNNNILHLASSGGNEDIVERVLMGTSIDINSRGRYGKTAAMIASEGGHIDVLDFLLQKGCDSSVVDDDDNNILHVACAGGDEECNVQMVQYILPLPGIDIKDVNKSGATAADIAQTKKHERILSLF